MGPVRERERAVECAPHTRCARHFVIECFIATEGCQDHAGAIGHHEYVRPRLASIFVGNRLNRRGIAGAHGSFERRQVGDEAGGEHEALEQRRALLFDKGGRFTEIALQFDFGLCPKPITDEVHTCADGHGREQCTREEDTVGERSKRSRHGIAISTSTVTPAGKVTDREMRGSPSYHPTTVYVPGGTRLRRNRPSDSVTSKNGWLKTRTNALMCE